MPIPSQIGAKGEDRQGEQDNPGQQAQGQAEGETPSPASAGKSLIQARLNHCQGVACWGANAAKE